MGQIIWQKTTTMNTTGGGAVMGSFPYPRNGIVKLDFEYILLFKKQGDAPKPTPEQKAQSAMTNEEWNTYFCGHWYFNGAKQDKHLAMFPEELPKRLIKMFSFPQETILDPFMGSGTTAAVAKALGRNSVGYEINGDFIPLIKDRIGSNNLIEKVQIDYIEQSVNIGVCKPIRIGYLQVVKGIMVIHVIGALFKRRRSPVDSQENARAQRNEHQDGKERHERLANVR